MSAVRKKKALSSKARGNAPNNNNKNLKKLLYLFLWYEPLTNGSIHSLTSTKAPVSRFVLVASQFND